MKTLLLHLGYPKTGTTTLQATLFSNAPALNFFAKGLGKIPQTANTFRTLVNYGTIYHVQNRAQAVLDDLVADISENREDRVLLSLEGLTNPFVDTHYAQPKDIFRKASDIRHILAPLINDGIRVKLLITIRQQTKLIPSLFSQVYLQGFSNGLYEASYESFLNFMLNDELLGFGPDFQYDAFLDHCEHEFGAENVFAARMEGVLSQKPCQDMAVLADFMELSEEECIALIGDGKLNVRNKGKRRGRRMMVVSGGVERFQRNTGISMIRKAFSVADQLRIKRGKRVFWHLADHSEMIAAYYAPSNTRLAEKYDITF